MPKNPKKQQEDDEHVFKELTWWKAQEPEGAKRRR
jgi:hypothetical protein